MGEIGRILQEGRKARGLAIEEVAQQTCISTFYLKAMEQGRFHLIPKVFDKGYLKLYGKLLDLDIKALLALYERETNNEHDRHLAGAGSH
jgi:cytoskeletal protein RodZ